MVGSIGCAIVRLLDDQLISINRVPVRTATCQTRDRVVPESCLTPGCNRTCSRGVQILQRSSPTARYHVPHKGKSMTRAAVAALAVLVFFADRTSAQDT